MYQALKCKKVIPSENDEQCEHAYTNVEVVHAGLLCIKLTPAYYEGVCSQQPEVERPFYTCAG
jgi:hypothetical protein